MKWNIDEDLIEFYSISNPERPMPLFSSQFFNINEYDRVQGGLTYNPIKKLKTLSDNSRTRTFTVQEIADYYGNKPEFVKQQLLLLAIQGFIFYDFQSDVVVLKDKLFHYFLSSYKLSDFDNIQFESVLKDRTQKNAIVDLKTKEMKLNGVKNIVVSDSQATVFFPKDGNLIVRKNRDMKFELSFTNREITPWGGMVFLKQMLDKIGFREQILNCEHLPVSLSNNSYKIFMGICLLKICFNIFYNMIIYFYPVFLNISTILFVNNANSITSS
jgi:hypothetical protein